MDANRSLNLREVSIPVETDVIAPITGGMDITRPYYEALLRSQDDVLEGKGLGDPKIYDEILSDARTKACYEQRFRALTKTEIEVVPGGERRIDQRAADFIDKEINSVPFDAITEQMAYAVHYGVSFAECLWAVRPGEVRLDADNQGGIVVRNRRRFRFAPDKQPRLITSQNLVTGIELPPRKFWHYSYGANNSDEPYGKGLAHNLYWLVLFKRGGMRFWLTFLESFGAPTPLGKYPPGTSKADQNKLLQVVKSIRTGAGGVIPEGMLIDLLEAGRSGSADYATLWDKLNEAISALVIGQSMTMDSNSNRAQATVGFEGVLQSIVKSDADMLCKSFNEGPVRWLTDWNFPEGTAYPQVWRRIPKEKDLKQQADRDNLLANMGFRPTAEYIQETYGDGFADAQQPDPDAPPQPLFAGLGVGGTQALVDFLSTNTLPKANAVAILQTVFGISPEAANAMIPEQQEPDPTEPPPGQPPTEPPQPEETQPPTPPTDPQFAEPIDPVLPIIEKATGKQGDLMDGLINPVRLLLQQSSTLEQVRDGLYDLYPDLDKASFAELLGQAMFLAELAGRFEVSQDG